ncbi:MAG: hypothetical protein J6P96_05535, partial [Bacteroidaceae bacterium]|nr:hypothetical protein [Bacteroidaceae bacterium]
ISRYFGVATVVAGVNIAIFGVATVVAGVNIAIFWVATMVAEVNIAIFWVATVVAGVNIAIFPDFVNARVFIVKCFSVKKSVLVKKLPCSGNLTLIVVIVFAASST